MAPPLARAHRHSAGAAHASRVDAATTVACLQLLQDVGQMYGAGSLIYNYDFKD